MKNKAGPAEEEVLLSNYSSVPGRKSMSETTPHFATTTIAVEGMTCGACTSAVEGMILSNTNGNSIGGTSC